MNRRDLDLISRTIRDDWPLFERKRVAETFANALGGQVAGFDREKFLQRCGVHNERGH